MSKTDRFELKKNELPGNPDFEENVARLLADLTDGEDLEGLKPEDIRLLAEELDHHPDLAEGLMQKILSQQTDRLLRTLGLLGPRVNSKAVHKKIKRTCYLLKQKGVTLPIDPKKKEDLGGSGILKAMDSVQVTGYLSEFDPARNRMLAMLIPKAPKGKVFMFALIEPEGSLDHLTAVEVSKKGAKEILGDLAEQSGHAFLEADSGHVAFLLKEAHDRKSNLSPDDEGIYSAILGYLGGSKTMNPLPIIRSLFSGFEESRERSLDMTRLLSIPEVHYYQLKDEWVKPYQQSIEDVESSVLILNPFQKREQVIDITHRAGREIFQNPVKTDLLRYLEEVSYLYYLKGREEEAWVCYAAARSLANEKSTENFGENLLLIWLTERALGGEHLGEHQGPEDQVEEKSEGGIIIPPWVKK